MIDVALASPRLTYESLCRELRCAALRYAFTRGRAGPLAFVWSIGLAALTLQAGSPLYAILWSSAILAMGGAALRSSFSNPRVLELVIPRVVDQSLPRHQIRNGSIVTILERSRAVFAQIALKVVYVQGQHPTDPGMQSLVGEAHSLLALQQQAGVQGEEFARALAFVRADLPERVTEAKQRSDLNHAGEPLWVTNLARVQDEKRHQEDIVAQILEQLETLLLQLMQLELQPWEVVEAAELVRESAENLERLQQEVRARESVARRVIADFAQQ